MVDQLIELLYSVLWNYFRTDFNGDFCGSFQKIIEHEGGLGNLLNLQFDIRRKGGLWCRPFPLISQLARALSQGNSLLLFLLLHECSALVSVLLPCECGAQEKSAALSGCSGVQDGTRMASLAIDEEQ